MLDNFFKGITTKNSEIGSIAHLARMSAIEKEEKSLAGCLKNYNDDISLLFFSKRQKNAITRMVERIFYLLKLPNDDPDIFKQNIIILHEGLRNMIPSELLELWKSLEVKTNIQVNSSIDKIMLGKMQFKITHDNSISARTAISDLRNDEFYKRFEMLPQSYEIKSLIDFHLKNENTDELYEILKRSSCKYINEIFANMKSSSTKINPLADYILKDTKISAMIFSRLSVFYRKKRKRSETDLVMMKILKNKSDADVCKYLDIFREKIRSKKLFWEFFIRNFKGTQQAMVVKFLSSKAKEIKSNDLIQIINMEKAMSIAPTKSIIILLMNTKHKNVARVIKEEWKKLPEIIKNIYCFVYNDFDVEYEKSDIEQFAFYQFMKNPLNLIRGCFSKDMKYRETCSDVVKSNIDVFSKLSIDPRINLSIPYKERLEKCRKDGFMSDNLFDPNNNMRLHACKELGFTPHHTNDTSVRIAFEAKKIHGFTKGDMKHPFSKIRMTALETYGNIDGMLSDPDPEIVKRGKEIGGRA